MRLYRIILLWILVLTAAWWFESPALAQVDPDRPRIDATRFILSHGRVDGVRIEGIAAGLTVPPRTLADGTRYPGVNSPPDSRPGKMYRNIPGITGLYRALPTVFTPANFIPPLPLTVLETINAPATPNPYLVTLDINRDGVPDVRSPIVLAARTLPSSFTLLVAENAGRVRWDELVRFGEGNLYATVPIDGTDIIPGYELAKKKDFDDYRANSILYEAPDVGNVIVDEALDGGTVNITAQKGALVRQVSYANPVEVEIEVLRQRELPSGACEVLVRANLDTAFGNTLVELIPVVGYTWFRWAVEDDTGTLIQDVLGTNQFLFNIPVVPGERSGDLVNISLVASSWGPYITFFPPFQFPFPFLFPFPFPTVWNNPFVIPQPRPPNSGSVQLDTFLSHASTLPDTETISRADCDPIPIRVDKRADPESLDEPGGNVTYTVTITNISDRDSVTIDTIIDDQFGDISDSCSPRPPVTLPPRGTITCTFTRSLQGREGDVIRDTVVAAGAYVDGGTPVEASDRVEVTIGQGQPGHGPAALTQSIVILLDASNSMRDNDRMEQAKRSASRVLDRVLGGAGDKEVALIVFYDCGNIVVEQDFTTDVRGIKAILAKIQPTGDTPLGEAIAFAKQYIRKNAKGASSDLVILTDGKETCDGDPLQAAGE